jgi:hypothetical protein
MEVPMQKIKIQGPLKYDRFNITSSLSELYSVHTAFWKICNDDHKSEFNTNVNSCESSMILKTAEVIIQVKQQNDIHRKDLEKIKIFSPVVQ